MLNEDLEKQNEDLILNLFHLINYVSNWNTLADQVIEHIKTEHPTILQNFFNMIEKVILEYSKYEYPDARNQDSVNWAKEIVEKVRCDKSKL